MRKDTAIQAQQKKIDQLNQQAWDIRVNDSPKAFKLSQGSLKLARKINYKKGIAEATRSMGFCYVRLSKNDEALPLLNESLSLFEELRDLKNQAVVYEYLGVIKRNRGDLGSALQLFFKAVALSQQTGATENEAIHHYQIGVSYKYLGNFDKALDSQFKSISIHKENKNRHYQSYPINVIGAIYFETGDYKKALEYFKEGLKLRQEFKDKLGEAGSLDNIGYTLFKLKKYSQALSYCKKGLAISKATDDKRSQASALQHLAEIHAQAGDTKQAIISSNASRKIRKATGDKRGEAEILLFLANLPQQDPEKVVEWIKEALRIANETRSPEIQSRAHHSLYNFYKQEGQFKEANRELEKHFKLEKELQKNSVDQKVANLDIARKAEETRKEAAVVMDRNEELTRLNKELEIETSLERVRAVAMGMKKRDDMLDVCTTISLQLQALGVKEIRNVQTAIFYPAKGTYMNYEYYAKHKKTFITDVDYTNHKVHKDFAAKMIKGKGEFYTTHIKGEKVKDWIAYQKTTNVFIDKYLNQATSLTYYWHSLGPVALGISTYVPLSKTDSDLFKRFLNVFELAYTRYLDIEKAQAQAREAQIEASLERVRAKALAMHDSKDISATAGMVLSELKKLDINPQRFAVGILEKGSRKADSFSFISSTGADNLALVGWINLKGHPVLDKVYNCIRSGEGYFPELSGDQFKSYYKSIATGLSLGPVSASELKQKQFGHFIPISVGYLVAWSNDRYKEAELKIIRRFASIIDLTFRRYQDLKKAEAQAKEAKIEAALEKVRAQAMGMQKPGDILNVCKVMFKELPGIGFTDVRNALINFWDDTNSSLIDYDYSDFAGGKIARLSYSSHPVFEQFQKRIRNSKDAFAQLTITKDQLASWQKRRRDDGEYEDPRLNKISALYYYFYSIGVGAIGISTFSPLPPENQELLKRFRNVFDLAYRRYLDIEKAEAQAKEAQIELALERVRARTMAMQKSEELNEVIEKIYNEFQQFGSGVVAADLMIITPDRKGYDMWVAGTVGTEGPYRTFGALLDHPHHLGTMEAWKRGDSFRLTELAGKLYKSYFELILSESPGFISLSGDHTTISKDRKTSIRNLKGIVHTEVFGKCSCIRVAALEKRTEEQIDIQKRFARVFEQTYTRFLDLEKAEAQAREAQIELALERVRARTMAMQKADELADVVGLLYRQFQELDFGLYQILVSIIDLKNNVIEWWSRGFKDTSLPQRYLIPIIDHPFSNKQREKWESGASYYAHILEGDTKKSWEDYLFTQTELKNFPKQVKDQMRSLEKVYLSDAFMKHGVLQAAGPAPLPDDKAAILRRFAKVLDLAYTRYLDIEQAQTQAREAQIELALERVRARTMAMQRSDELPQAANLLFQQVQSLGMPAWSAGYCIWDDDKQAISLSMSSEGVLQPTLRMPLTEDPSLKHFREAYERGESFFVEEVGGKALKDHYTYLRTLPGVKETLDDIEKAGFPVPTFQIFHLVYFSKGFLLFITYELVPEAHDIFKRFGKVFDQTYTRFLDLQKAEAQTREAQIEVAVERVRAKALAMHRSEDMHSVVVTLKKELMGLQIPDITAATIYLAQDDGSIRVLDLSDTGEEDDDKPQLKLDKIFRLEDTDPDLWIRRMWDRKENYFVLEADEDDFVRVVQWLRTIDPVGAEVAEKIILDKSIKKVWLPTVKLEKGIINIDLLAPPGPEIESILLKMSAGFDLAYKRFLDLQKAEAQAREAQIEASLERVRSASMAMHSSDELQNVIRVLTDQLTVLGFEFHSANFITNASMPDWEIWISSPGSNIPPKLFVPYFDHRLFNERNDAVSSGKDMLTVVLSPEEKTSFLKYFFNHSVAKNTDEDRIKWVLDQPGMALTTVVTKSFSLSVINYYGKLYAESENEVIKRLAYVFEQSYTRFLDLKKAEAQAREAKIEAALERTRTQSMIMQHSSELDDSLRVFHEQVLLLGINSAFSYLWLPDEENERHVFWAAWQEDKSGSTLFKSKSINYPLDRNEPATAQCLVDWKSNEPIHSYHLLSDGVENYFATWKELLEGVEKLKPEYFRGGLYYIEAFMKYGCFGVMSIADLTEDEKKLLNRFAIEFERTYTRFLDLQNAEEQARESQVQLALERVRARTMAMQKSDELPETSHILFEQMKELGEPVEQLSIGIVHEENNVIEISATLHGDTLKKIYLHSIDEPYMMTKVYKAWKTQQKTLIVELKGDELNSYNKYRNELTNSEMFPTNLGDEHRRIVYAAFFSKGMLALGANEPRPPQSLQLLERFASVFDLTYTRFLDLQKAEAQAREAQIEAALERVRSRTMAMHNSNDLLQVIEILKDQLQQLGFEPDAVNFITDLDQNGYRMWLATPGGTILRQVYIPRIEYRGTRMLEEAVRNKTEMISYVLTKEEKDLYFRNFFENTALKDIPEEFRNQVYEEPGMAISLFVLNSIVLTVANFKAIPLTVEQNVIVRRFAKVFEQSYTRFLDLQKAEAQAKEAQVEAALERVRAKAMAMHRSEDFNDAIAVVFEELKKLDIGVLRCGISVLDKEKRTGNVWVTSTTDQGSAVQVSGDESFDIHPLLKEAFEAWLRQEDFYYLLEGDDLKNYYKAVKATNIQLPESQMTSSGTAYRQYCFTAVYQAGGLFAFCESEFPDEAKRVIKRFAGVFDLTYKRFVDLQNAEAQAREAQIEVSLERVRAHAMAMHSSADLSATVNVFFKELKTLGINPIRCGVGEMNEGTHTSDLVFTTADKQGELYELPGKLKHEGHPVIENIYNYWKRQEEYHPVLQGADINTYYRVIKSQMILPDFPEYSRHYGNYFYFKEGFFFAWGDKEFTQEGLNICRRFTTVLSLTYKRYKDLKQAEAQSKESQIQLALERVRARTMAMQHSDELADASVVLFQQFAALGQTPDRISIGIINEENDTSDVWATDQQGTQVNIRFNARNNERTTIAQMVKDWKAGKRSTIIDLQGDDLKDWITYLRTELGMTIDDSYFHGRRIHQVSFFSQGWLNITTLEPLPAETLDLLDRFSAVFNLTYTRFVDLKKAEAQAREAQIEAALERVRAKVIGMNHSHELQEISYVFGDQMRQLGVDWQFSYFWLIEEQNDANTFWITWPDNHTSVTSYSLAEADQYTKECLVVWKRGDKIHSNHVQPGEVKLWLDTFGQITEDAGPAAKAVMQPDNFKNGVYYYDAMMKYGSFGICNNRPATEEESKIQCRFAIEFERAYTRFLDLKNAEAQTREATIEVALERVRARALAMQEPEELKSVAEVLRNEMGLLGVEELETCSIYINDTDAQRAECWYALKDIRQEGKKLVNDHFALDLNDTWVGRQMLAFYDSKAKQTSIVMQGDNRKEWIKYCEERSAPFRGYYGEVIPDRTYHLYKFSHGAIGAASAGDISAESWKLLNRAASVFSLAYSRFKDLTQARIDLQRLKEEKQRAETALSELQLTQTQLIQSEKMASLGELTAGIAHEIQNPLNFVNNFSEVSNELLDEMVAEVKKGNYQDVEALVNDVKQNLEKINHHGKRADGIVKGMLQHSRSSSGQKELTDINVLCDEYLRLSYHGLRAKDKSFNAKFETDFGQDIPKITVVPQEIGRVILNLINNAFYAVSERKKLKQDKYEPTVTVSTRKNEDKVEVRVNDNGTGIPQKVLEKIFQPFFTTKPTGQGTGLGLSLSYDIVKSHGGELKVETKENEGSEFIIQLPVQ